MHRRDRLQRQQARQIIAQIQELLRVSMNFTEFKPNFKFGEAQTVKNKFNIKHCNLVNILNSLKPFSKNMAKQEITTCDSQGRIFPKEIL